MSHHYIDIHNNRELAEWLKQWTCDLEAVYCWRFESYSGQDFFCNVHLFRFPRSWTGSVQA